MIWIVLIYACIFAVASAYVFFWMHNFFLVVISQERAPFVPLPSMVVRELPELIEIPDGSLVFDLGCGDGRILKTFYEKNPRAKYVGIENSCFPFLLAKFFNRKILSPSFQIKRQNFFKTDISEADIIFVYLFPKVLEALLPKFQKELKKGTVVYAPDFQFGKNKTEDRILYPKKAKSLGRKIYVYKF